MSEKNVIAKDGRFGVYVTDGETNASLGKGDRLEEITPERAFELLAIRREAIIAKGGTPAQEGQGHQEEGRRQEEERREEERSQEEGAGEEEGERTRRAAVEITDLND